LCLLLEGKRLPLLSGSIRGRVEFVSGSLALRISGASAPYAKPPSQNPCIVAGLPSVSRLHTKRANIFSRERRKQRRPALLRLLFSPVVL